MTVFILQWQARFYIKKFKPDIILVFGQINRSNIKEEIVKELINNGYKARGNLKGYNSEIGVPLSILNLQAGFSSLFRWLKLFLNGFSELLFQKSPNEIKEILVLEVTIDKLKDIKYLFKYKKPKIVVFSDFGANFSKNNQKIVSDLINLWAGESRIILNENLELSKSELKLSNNKIYKFGLSEKSLIRAYNLQQFENSQQFSFNFNGEVGLAKLNKFGIHAIGSYLVAKFILNYFKKI
jgi:UDP-N-acetylmuramyl pentapeptide synthase